MLFGRIVSASLAAGLLLRAQIPDFTPPTPLLGEVLHNNTAGVARLLEQGADPNQGRFLGFSPLFFPIMYQNQEVFRGMVAKGADIKATDGTGSTTLMWAAFNEAGDPALVQELLRLGVDPNARNKNGETALIWALRRGNTPVVAALKEAGASDGEMIQASVEKAVAVLQKSGPEFVRVSGCTSCHHQSLPQMAVAAASARGYKVDEKGSRLQVEAVTAMFNSMRAAMEKAPEKIPDPAITVSYALLGLAADKYPANDLTRTMAAMLSKLQLPDGSFRTMPMRPPLESSDFTATAFTLRALALYGSDMQEQIRKAGEWLRQAKPRTNEDRAMQILGLDWAKADGPEMRQSAAVLLAAQRADGGWAQLPGLETDAYATGQALVALRNSGMLGAADPAYQRGVGFLLRTQRPDGSWIVRSRTYPVQPYKESGFPHGKDQWISASGTSWAAMALSLSVPARQEISWMASGM